LETISAIGFKEIFVTNDMTTVPLLLPRRFSIWGLHLLFDIRKTQNLTQARMRRKRGAKTRHQNCRPCCQQLKPPSWHARPTAPAAVKAAVL
jgi:hypothetical protein